MHETGIVRDLVRRLERAAREADAERVSGSPHLLPRYAICDPVLTMSMPPALAAATGIGAIAHCIETFLLALVNPPADAIALDGLERAVWHIERSVRLPLDISARSEMMMAALEGGLCF